MSRVMKAETVIEYLAPDEIKVGNRLRSDLGDIEELALSIATKGQIQPITIDMDDRLVAGERRLEAFKAALKSHPRSEHLKKGIMCVRRKIKDELDFLEIELFENLHRKAMTWQESAKAIASIHNLMVEKYGEKNWGTRATAKLIDSNRTTIHNNVEMAAAMESIPELATLPTLDSARKKFKRLLEDVAVQQNKEKSAEVLQKAEAEAAATGEEVKVKLSTMSWCDDHYRIGDTIEGMASRKAHCANFAEVDPPYGIDLQAQKNAQDHTLEDYNEVDKDDYPLFLKSVAEQVYRCLTPNSFCIWWYGWEWHNTVFKVLRETGFKVDPIPAVWVKVEAGAQSTNPEVNLSRSHEPFFVARKGNPLLFQRARSNVFAFKPVAAARKVHPTERPIEMMQDILKTFAMSGAKVLVPFMGSGVTARAAYREEMIPFGYDLSEEYKRRFLAAVHLEYPNEVYK